MTYSAQLNALNPITAAICGFVAVSCASSVPVLPTNSVAVGTASFELERPVFFARPTGAFIEGRACRRGLSTLLSPEHVRLEDISSAGEVRHVALAYLPLLPVKFTERCEHYNVAVKWCPSPGDVVRACFERGRGCLDRPAN